FGARGTEADTPGGPDSTCEVAQRRGGFDEAVSDGREPGRRAGRPGRRVEMADRRRLGLRGRPGVGPGPGHDGTPSAGPGPGQGATPRGGHVVWPAGGRRARAVAVRPGEPDAVRRD